MIFSKELRDDVLAGEITVSFRLWKRPKVKEGGRYPVGPGSGLIEVDSIELITFADITDADVRRAGEPDREGRREYVAVASEDPGESPPGGKRAWTLLAEESVVAVDADLRLHVTSLRGW